MENASKVLRWVSFGFETILAIPILGGLIIAGLWWTPLFLMLILHIITLVICSRSGNKIYGSIIGIVASVLGFIPFIGWGLHLAAAISLLVSLVGSGSSSSQKNININLSNIGNSSNNVDNSNK
jgi:hypothetical protein